MLNIKFKIGTLEKYQHLPFGDHPWAWIWGRKFNILKIF
jgi:hypothetical protein